MIGLVLPIILAVAGIGAAFFTYQGIRRGGARYYTLERESLLRQASLTLLLSTILFLASIGLMAYDQQQLLAEDTETAVVDGEDSSTEPNIVIQAEETPELNTLPPLPTETATPGPTLSPTPLICRAVVEGTFDNGLTLRTNPGGSEVDILAESAILTVITEEDPVELNGFRWRKVRSLLGDEGWVAEDFITLGSGCE